jgi:uncharacterized protein (TIGR02145 family)
MQGMTQDYCASMPIYDPSAPDARSTITLTDTRNSQQYDVRKLQDGKCWMITNLKIANYAATADDTDLTTGSVATNGFTIPSLTPSSGNSSAINPYVYGPVTGDSSGTAGSTSSNDARANSSFFGYMYNWSAATAGESQSTTSGNAANSICPSGWKLPRDGDFSKLNTAFSSNINNWFNNGWRGVKSGYWAPAGEDEAGFAGPGVVGFFWAATASVGPFAYVLNLSSANALIVSGMGRDSGLAVRCVAEFSDPVAETTTLTVTFDGNEATDVTVSPDGKTITATTPAHAAGAVDVTIDDGLTSATLPNGYTYTDRPVMLIDDISPNHDIESGGTTVTITGSNIIPSTSSTPTTMQAMTQEYCTSMPIYNPTNPDEASTTILKDTRNDQEYTIRRLQDGKCWMVNNLKLGSTTSTTPLTDQDTNLTTKTSFTLPQLYNGTSGHSSNTVPYTFGPLTDDVTYNNEDYDTNDITSDHFGGYLYNWTAAIAEDDSSSIAGYGDVAPNSICPKGWRLPQGGNIGDPTNDFDVLNAKMAGYTDNGTNYQNDFSYYDSTFYNNWLPTGSFRGVFSGGWYSGFDFQSDYGDFWSSSVYSSYHAFDLDFNDGDVGPSDYDPRSNGFGVRCVVNENYTLTPATPTVTLDAEGTPVEATVTDWDDNSITATVPAHAPGLVSVTVDNGIDTATIPATCALAGSTACNGQLDSGETRNGDRANIVSGFLYEEEYVSLVLDSNLNIADGKNFTTGAVASGTDLTVYTNAASGYSLSIASQSDSSDLIGPNGNRIAGVEGTLDAPVTLSNGTWGFAIGSTNSGLVSNGFNPMILYVGASSGSQAFLNSTKWAKLPSSTDPTLTIKQTNFASEYGDTTSLFYGLKTDITQPGGTYSNTVVYTVVKSI